MFDVKTLLAGVLALMLGAGSAVALKPGERPEAPDMTHAFEPAPADAGAKRSSAWTLSGPLGMHIPSTIDTLMLNYQRTAIPSMVTDAYATTGNLGAEGQSQIYFDRRPLREFFFLTSLEQWCPTFQKQKYYNVYVPMTLAYYGFGGNSDSGQDRLGFDFAGNVNRRIGIGASLEYLYSKGSYNYQALKHFNYGLSGYYLGDRYQMQAFFQHYNMLNKENGGITDDLYITDPAELQGGVKKIEAKSIPTVLNNAHTRLRGKEFYMSHTYNVGFWKEVEVNDTLTREVYVPVTKFIYSLDYQESHHQFRNTGNASLWGNRYLNASATKDNTSFAQLSNTLGIQMIEGFRKWAKFGLTAYATLENRRYKQANLGWTAPEPGEGGDNGLTPLPEGVAIAPKANRTVLWVGGRIDREQGCLLNYSLSARFGLSGDNVGDIDIDGNISTRFRLLGDTIHLDAYAHLRNTAQPYLLQHYISNYYAWQNSFGKTRSLMAGGHFDLQRTGTSLDVMIDNMQNYVYFGTDGLPRQYGGTVQVFAARLKQMLHFGMLHWDNTLTLQTSTNRDVLPLPAFTIYSNLYLKFRAFKVLNLQVGLDCDYYTRYRGVNYDPATTAFRVGDDWKIGNFPFCNIYVSAKLYKARFYVLYSHINQGWFTKQYFSMPHYPVNPRRLMFGLSVDFAN